MNGPGKIGLVIKPRPDYLLVKKFESNMSPGGLHLPEQSNKQNCICEIIDRGSNINDIYEPLIVVDYLSCDEEVYENEYIIHKDKIIATAE
jgi:hypothetical protein